MKISPRDAYLATVAYADIFNFPLTKDEIRQWLLFYSGKSMVLASRETRRVDGYHFLAGRTSIVGLRQRRKEHVLEKISLARKMADLLKLVPSIKLVGVTGGLAMGNAEPTDDIDFFLITSKGTLWISRFLATVLIEATGRRRRPATRQIKNTICLNMFMSENHLGLPKSDQDLFSAHEVLQMLPLWEREGTYQKFLKANSWVKYFLPNAWKEKYQGAGIKYYGKKRDIFLITLIHNTSTAILRLFESLARAIQLWYMKRHRTTEVISATVIRFHPRDARVWVKQALGVRLGRYNIPLDNIFYNR